MRNLSICKWNKRNGCSSQLCYKWYITPGRNIVRHDFLALNPSVPNFPIHNLERQIVRHKTLQSQTARYRNPREIKCQTLQTADAQGANLADTDNTEKNGLRVNVSEMDPAGTNWRGYTASETDPLRLISIHMSTPWSWKHIASLHCVLI